MDLLQISENATIALKEVESNLKERFGWEFSGTSLKNAVFHLLNVSGKLLRPTLVFVGAESVGLNSMKFVDLALAIEYLHTASLIHDDIVDKDRTRRGVDAVHVKYGMENAILAADALIARAVALSAPYGENVVRKISEAAFAMSDGESMDFCTQRSNVEMSIQNYTEIAKKKTASLISTSISIAAVSEKLSAEVSGKLARVGELLGIGFQIRDDVINSVGAMELGKREGRGDKTFNRPNIVTVFERRGDDRHTALDKSVSLMSQYVSNALGELAHFENIDHLKSIIMVYFDEEELRKYL